jgi:hypothetical protein
MSTHRTPPPDERYFLVAQSAIDRIDALVGALNLAITEILEAMPVRDYRDLHIDYQDDFDRKVGDVVYRGEWDWRLPGEKTTEGEST